MEREGEVKELHSYEQVQCWAKRRMMDWALSGLQLVFGGNKWSGRHAEYTTLAIETPMLEHLGNLFRGKPHANCWTKLSGWAWTLIKIQILLWETYLCVFYFHKKSLASVFFFLVLRGESPRWLSCISPHSPRGKIWEARGGLIVVTSGGDTLSFLFHVWASFLEDIDLCVYHRAPPLPPLWIL